MPCGEGGAGEKGDEEDDKYDGKKKATIDSQG